MFGTFLTVKLWAVVCSPESITAAGPQRCRTPLKCSDQVPDCEYVGPSDECALSGKEGASFEHDVYKIYS